MTILFATLGFICAACLLTAVVLRLWGYVLDLSAWIVAPKERTRDARRIRAETDRWLADLEARSLWDDLDGGTTGSLDRGELGIGAAVFGDAVPRFGQGAADPTRNHGRVLRPSPWLVDDSHTYEGTSLVRENEGPR